MVVHRTGPRESPGGGTFFERDFDLRDDRVDAASKGAGALQLAHRHSVRRCGQARHFERHPSYDIRSLGPGHKSTRLPKPSAEVTAPVRRELLAKATLLKARRDTNHRNAALETATSSSTDRSN